MIADIINYELSFNRDNNYYKQTWRVFLDNENLLKEVQEVASDNLKVLKRIYNVENYYETVLMPKMLSFPKQYMEKIKQ